MKQSLLDGGFEFGLRCGYVSVFFFITSSCAGEVLRWTNPVEDSIATSQYCVGQALRWASSEQDSSCSRQVLCKRALQYSSSVQDRSCHRRTLCEAGLPIDQTCLSEPMKCLKRFNSWKYIDSPEASTEFTYVMS